MAAVAVAAIAAKKSLRTSIPDDQESRSATIQLPPSEEWLNSGELEKRVFGADEVWNRRRLVLTKDLLSVTRTGSADALDQIFLVDIERTQVKQPYFPSLPPSPPVDEDLSQAEFVFEIKTIFEGHTAGRS